MRREVPIEEAVGSILAHDLTRVVPGGFKGVEFPAGHRIRVEDLEQLRAMGKEHLWVLTLEPGEVHENTAATRVAEAVAGEGIRLEPAQEGKVNLVAEHDGLLLLEAERITALNLTGEIALVTLPGRRRVEAGERVASVKVIPLTVSEEAVRRREEEGTLLKVVPFRPLKVRMVTTGREVASGRIEDGFRAAVAPKLARVGAQLQGQVIVTDDADAIALAIREALSDADLVLVTGGMSVDPDDVTPRAIALTGVTVAVQGAPVLPGSMSLVGYVGEKVVLGLPAAVLHDPLTLFDLLLVWVAAGLRPSREDVLSLGVGGLLELCPTCHTSRLAL